jgi:hypothetical protein
MHPDYHANLSPGPKGPQTEWAVFGALMIIAGVLCGGGWTLLVLAFEPRGASARWNGVPLAGILTLVATICWIAAGAVMIKTSLARERMLASAKDLGLTAVVLAAIAVSGYFFGFIA